MLTSLKQNNIIITSRQNFEIPVGPTECQDGVTNNYSQICTRRFLNMYECGCNDGYLLSMDICIGMLIMTKYYINIIM